MHRVLVANRGEIACRIIAACRQLDLRTVAVFSEADAGALHVRRADDAVLIGPPPAMKSYLGIDALIDAAIQSSSDAVHPGYGMLSESSAFASAVLAAGLTWIGPPPEVMSTMADKVAARELAARCGMRVPAGTGDLDPARLTEHAREAAALLGYPLVVKASHGGGGRGMRVVRDRASLDASVSAAAREASAAFGRAEVHLERYLEHVRHVEVQVLADGHGNVLHLFDRDCSVQRRHQKLIEEAPAIGLPEHARTEALSSSLRLAREVGYVGPGTVEFIFDPRTAELSFLEMNARLQVEHGVTELVTGVDIVVEQLRVAAGEPLTWAQHQLRVAGHAIQARIVAEDPWSSFQPTAGPVTGLRLPYGPGLRIDFGVEAGDQVRPEYDSMFGKLLAHGADRDAARRALIAALDELRVDGVPTTAPYLRDVLSTKQFIAGEYDTESIARDWPPHPSRQPRSDPAESAQRLDPAVTGTVTKRTVHIVTPRGSLDIDVFGNPPNSGLTTIGSRRVGTKRDDVEGRQADGAVGALLAPMDATVVAVHVRTGDRVSDGEVLVVLEAMKMQLDIATRADAIVSAVYVAVGQSVNAGCRLVLVEAPES